MIVRTSIPGRPARVHIETADGQLARIVYFLAASAARKGTLTELVDDAGETVEAEVSVRARPFKVALGARKRRQPAQSSLF